MRNGRQALMAIPALMALVSGSAARAQEGGPSVDDTLAYINNLLVHSSNTDTKLVVDGGRLCIKTWVLDQPDMTYDGDPRLNNTNCAALANLAVNKIGLNQRDSDSGPVDELIIGCAPATLNGPRNCWQHMLNGSRYKRFHNGPTYMDMDSGGFECSKMGNCYNAFVHLLRLLNVKETGVEDPFK